MSDDTILEIIVQSIGGKSERWRTWSQRAEDALSDLRSAGYQITPKPEPESDVEGTSYLEQLCPGGRDLYEAWEWRHHTPDVDSRNASHVWRAHWVDCPHCPGTSRALREARR